MSTLVKEARPMPPTKNLYVRDEDMPTCERAEVLAKVSKQSLSQLATLGLRALLGQDPEILVHVTDPDRPGEIAEIVDGRHVLEYLTKDPEYRMGMWRLTERHDDPNVALTPGGPLDPPLDWARERIAGWQRDRAAESANLMEDIEVEIGDRNDNRWTEVFAGRWLIYPEDGNRFGADAGAAYGIAQTKRGKIAVYCYHVNERWAPSLEVFDSLDEVDLSEEALAIAAAELGEKRVIRRDI
jgi:hypothetical protein